MVGDTVKTTEGTLYEVYSVVIGGTTAPAYCTPVYNCYRLSNYDGMPIGMLVNIDETQISQGWDSKRNLR
jgi:hypothetical protein